MEMFQCSIRSVGQTSIGETIQWRNKSSWRLLIQYFSQFGTPNMCKISLLFFRVMKFFGKTIPLLCSTFPFLLWLIIFPVIVPLRMITQPWLGELRHFNSNIGVKTGNKEYNYKLPSPSLHNFVTTNLERKFTIRNEMLSFNFPTQWPNLLQYFQYIWQ